MRNWIPTNIVIGVATLVLAAGCSSQSASSPPPEPSQPQPQPQPEPQPPQLPPQPVPKPNLTIDDRASGKKIGDQGSITCRSDLPVTWSVTGLPPTWKVTKTSDSEVTYGGVMPVGSNFNGFTLAVTARTKDSRGSATKEKFVSGAPLTVTATLKSAYSGSGVLAFAATTPELVWLEGNCGSVDVVADTSGMAADRTDGTHSWEADRIKLSNANPSFSSENKIEQGCTSEGEQSYEKFNVTGAVARDVFADGEFDITLLFSGRDTCGPRRLLSAKVTFR